MRVYLASRFSRLPELLEHKAELEDHGIEVTSRWLLGGHEWVGTSDEEIPVARNHIFATEDLEDIKSADVIVCFTEPARSGPARNCPGPDDIEEWRDIPGSTCGYRISSWGRVTGASGDFISGSQNRGCWYVKPNGKNSRRITIHSLVAAAFLGPCPSGMEIDHKDGDKGNNWIGNLEYVTHQENVRRAVERGLYDHHGERNGRSRLTANQAYEIRRRFETGERNKSALAREYGVGPTAVYRIVTGQSWNGERPSHGGKDFEAGYAYAIGKPIVVVGHRENVFYCLASMCFAEDWDHALQLLLNASNDGRWLR